MDFRIPTWLNILFLCGTLNFLDGVEGFFAATCGKCIKPKCPTIKFCTGKVVLDHCRCCSICSSDLYQPHVRFTPVAKEACQKVSCPKYKVCRENEQGLPLCICPSFYICRKRKKPVCGMDGVTYKSRCHMRVTACNSGKRIKVQRKGVCKRDAVAPITQTTDSDAKHKRWLARRKNKKRRRKKRNKRKLKGGRAKRRLRYFPKMKYYRVNKAKNNVPLPWL